MSICIVSKEVIDDVVTAWCDFYVLVCSAEDLDVLGRELLIMNIQAFDLRYNLSQTEEGRAEFAELMSDAERYTYNQQFCLCEAGKAVAADLLYDACRGSEVTRTDLLGKLRCMVEALGIPAGYVEVAEAWVRRGAGVQPDRQLQMQF